MLECSSAYLACLLKGTKMLILKLRVYSEYSLSFLGENTAKFTANINLNTKCLWCSQACSVTLWDVICRVGDWTQ